MPLQLLPVAGDDEQAVVDRQPEPEAGDEVEREDRELGHLDHRAQQQQRPGHRDGADERRQQRGDEPAEDPEREQEQERERDQLRAEKVALDDLADLAAGDGGAAEQNARLALEPVEQPLGAVLARLGADRPEERDEVPPIERADERDRRLRAELPLDPGALCGLDAGDDADVRIHARPALEALRRLDALRGRVAEIRARARLHQPRDGAAQRPGERSERRSRGEDPPRPPEREGRDHAGSSASPADGAAGGALPPDEEGGGRARGAGRLAFLLRPHGLEHDEGHGRVVHAHAHAPEDERQHERTVRDVGDGDRRRPRRAPPPGIRSHHSASSSPQARTASAAATRSRSPSESLEWNGSASARSKAASAPGKAPRSR